MLVLQLIVCCHQVSVPKHDPKTTKISFVSILLGRVKYSPKYYDIELHHKKNVHDNMYSIYGCPKVLPNNELSSICEYMCRI